MRTHWLKDAGDVAVAVVAVVVVVVVVVVAAVGSAGGGDCDAGGGRLIQARREICLSQSLSLLGQMRKG